MSINYETFCEVQFLKAHDDWGSTEHNGEECRSGEGEGKERECGGVFQRGRSV